MRRPRRRPANLKVGTELALAVQIDQLNAYMAITKSGFANK